MLNITSDVESQSVERLMKEGIAAAKARDFATAQARFGEALAQDGRNETGWLWLASVVEDVADKRECFITVLSLNPDNVTARRELDKLDQAELPITTEAMAHVAVEPPLRASSIEVIRPAEGVETDAPTPEAAPIGMLQQFLAPLREIPASTRRQLLALLAIMAIVIGAIVITHHDSPPPAQPPAAPVAQSNGQQPVMMALQDATLTPTASPVPPTATDILVTNQIQLSTVVPASLPATWTPAYTATSQVIGTATPLAGVPPNLPGTMAILSGFIATHNNFWPVILMSPDGSNRQQALTDPDRAEFVQLVPDGKHIIYTYATEGTDSHLLQIAFRNGQSARQVSEAWGGQPGFSDPRGDSLSADGHLLAFSAQNAVGGELLPAIFVVKIQNYLGLVGTAAPTALPTVNTTATVHAPPGILIGTSTPLPTAVIPATATPSLSSQFLIHVTPPNNGADSWPSIAPNDQFVSFTTDTTTLGENAIDLYVAVIQASSAPLRLTHDGGALIKSASNWSPDSKQIAFTSTPTDNSYSDIETINADGSNRQVLVHMDKTHNIRPIWSPDGKYIAFTSDRTGHDQVFLIDLASHQTYQVTTDLNTNILTDWKSK